MERGFKTILRSKKLDTENGKPVTQVREMQVPLIVNRTKTKKGKWLREYIDIPIGGSGGEIGPGTRKNKNRSI